MPTYKAGSASITVVPDLSNWHKRVKATLRSERVEAPVIVVPDFNQYGRKLETGLSRFRAEVGVTVKPDLRNFRRQLRTDLAGEQTALDLRVKLDFTQAREQMRAFRTEVGRDLSVNFDLDTTQALARIAALRTAARSINTNSVGALGGGSGGGTAAAATAGAQAVARAQANLDRISQQLTRSRRALGDASDRVALAETRLTEIQADSSSSASRLLQAEQNLARARRDLADATRTSNTLMGEHVDAHHRLVQAQRDSSTAGNALRSSVNGATGALSGMIRPASLATVGLIGLAAVNLVPLVGQLAQAAGVIALLPAAATSAAAALATVVIGSNGIVDAFKAASKATEDAAKDAAAAEKQAASDAKARAAAARGVATAQRGVESAAKGVERAEDGVARAERGVETAQKQRTRAQQALTDAMKDAQEQIEDLNLAMKGSQLDERDAELGLKRAQQRLAELGKDGQPVTRLDFEEAVLGVDQAKQRIDEVRERNEDLRLETEAANKAGVEGSAQVVAAQEGLVDADQAVTDSKLAVIEANESVAEAQQNLIESQERLVEAQNVVVESSTAATTSADKYREALNNLSPSARAFVEQTRDLGGAWGELRTQVQENLFSGLGTSITDLANNYFPLLKDGLGGIATEISGGLQRVIGDLNQESTKLDWSNILDNTRLAIGPFMDGLSSLAGALTNIASIGSDFLPGGAETFAEKMQQFEDWTGSDQGRERIRTFMQDSIDALREIKDLFVEVGRVIGGLFSTSEDNGKSMIQSMTDGLRDFADWMNSPEGQQKMQKFWDDAQQTASDLLTLTGYGIQLADKLIWIINNSGLGGGEGSPIDPKKPSNVGRILNPGGVFGGGTLQNIGLTLGFKNIQALADSIDFSGLLTKAKELAVGFMFDIGTTAVEAWQRLKEKVTEVVGWVSERIDNGKAKVVELKDDTVAWLESIGGSWDGLGSTIAGVIATLIDTAFPGLTNALVGVRDFFGGVVDGIGNKWGELRDLAASPINWVIANVINGGLRNAWNAVAGFVDLPKWDAEVPLIPVSGAGQGGGFNKDAVQRFATGGHVRGAGGPTDDRVPAMLSNGEYVLKASTVDKIGVDNLNRLNNNPLVAKGKVLAEGMFSGIKMATGGSVDEAIERAKRFMQGEHGKPYQYGGVGDPSWDCSGLWSGIVHELSGRSARSGRLFNTESDFESMGWKPGLDGRVTIGIMRGGGGENSHMAGTIDGTNAESSGTNGVQWGGAAIGSDHSSFGLQYTLQELAGEFVSGGMGSGSSGGGSFRSMLARKVTDLLQKPLDAIGSSIPNFGPSLIGQLPRKAFDAISKAALDFVRSKIGGTISGRATAADYPYEPGAGAEQWDANIRAALAREGFEVNDRNVNLTKAQIMTESSGNPNAVQQVQDVNSGGNEAVGLMQVIPGTFEAYRNPELPNDRTNPDASLSAALRWYRARYGDDLGQMWGQGHGYANGGIIPGYTPGRDKFQVGVSGGEAIMRPEWTRVVGSGYVDRMNALARKGGVEGIRQAMFQGFAQGGIVDPNEYLRNRLSQYGTQVAGIAKSAIPEILGISGTPLDLTNNRYVDAAMQIGTAVQSGVAAATAPNYGDPTSPNMSRTADRDFIETVVRAVIKSGAGGETHFHVSNIEEALRKQRLETQVRSMSFQSR